MTFYGEFDLLPVPNRPEPEPICDCCHKEAAKLYVCASTLGAFSNGFCPSCLIENAEPLGDLLGTYEDCGHEVMDWVLKTVTFVNGGYITFQEYLDQQ